MFLTPKNLGSGTDCERLDKGTAFSKRLLCY